MDKSKAYKKGQQKALNAIQNLPVNKQNQLAKQLSGFMEMLCNAEREDDTDQVLSIYNKIASSILNSKEPA